MLDQLLFALPSLAGVLLTVGIAAYAWHRRPGPSWRWVSLLGLAVAWWCAGQLVWVFIEDPGLRVLAGRLQYLGITATPVLWLAVALSYVGRRSLLAPRSLAALFFVPITTVLLVLTNDQHGLVWRSFEPVAGRIKAAVSYGTWFYVHTGYSYSLVTLGVVLLVVRFAGSPLYRVPLLVVLLGPAAVVIANLLQITASPLLPIDPTPASFAVAFVAMAWAVLRHHLFEWVPMARSRTVEKLHEGVVVLDPAGRVVDSNPAARALLELPFERAVGRPLPPWLADSADFAPGESREIRRPDGRVMEVRASIVDGADGVTEGRVLLLRDVTEERLAQDRLLEAQRELERQANTDPLTGLANRRRLLACLEEECARSVEGAGPLSLLLLDLDHFKRVNDERGHLMGDRVLEAVGAELAARLRPKDLGARFGGEELAVLLPETRLEDAVGMARRIWKALRELEHFDEAGKPFRVTVSIGVASPGPEGGSPRELLALTDRALYHTKETGRDGVSQALESGCERLETA